MYTDRFQTLQIDLVSACNARCPSCYRQDDYGRPQTHFPANVHLDLELLRKALRDPALEGLQEIFLCGNYGDAMASPRILEVLQIADEIMPGIGFYMHTNGSLGTQQTWSELGRQLSGRGRFVKFAIDGLEDTNSIYRRGVSWKAVMKNVQLFISEGGRAVWKFIVFDHNKHQIEEARALSVEMGFTRFETVRNYTPEREPFLAESQDPLLQEQGDYEVTSLPEENFSPAQWNQLQIRCDAKKEKSLFLDFDGRVWPCCWIGGWRYSANSLFRRKHIEYFDSYSAEKNFNSLQYATLSEVLSHPWFRSGLEESWTQPARPSCRRPHSLCIEKCGSWNSHA